MRLDKFLADCGVATRSQVKLILKAKRVAVNGSLQQNGKAQVNPQKDIVTLDGEPLLYEEFVYYLLNKPKGVISATEDARHATVLDILDDDAKRRQVFPVGRLDIDTHGLLLLTDDGQLAHRLLSPKHHVDKVYRAIVEGVMDEKDVQHFKEGITLADGYRCMSAMLELKTIQLETQSCEVTITIQEGKFHQVKNMVRACGKKVVDLQRISMGPLHLDKELPIGEFRRLTTDEVQQLQQWNA